MTVILVSPVPDVAGTALRAALAAGFGEVPVARDAAGARDAARACPRPVLVVDLRAATSPDDLPATLRRQCPSAPMLALRAAGHPVPSGADAVLTEPFYLEDVVRWCARVAEVPFDESMLADLATGMRHEIGNPLTSLLLQLELLKDEEAPASIRDQLGLIEDSGRRIQRVVEDVTVAAERRPVSAEEQRLDGLLEAARSRLADIAPELAERVVLEPGPAGAPERVEVEARLLARALADVWRFLALAGEGELRVTPLAADAGTLMLRTRARTTRLPPDAAARLFTPLWARHTLGLADELSLSTARGILRRHQGDLRARQEPGGLLRVDAILPVRAAGPATHGA